MTFETCSRLFRIISVGAIVHIVLLISVFDIHFRSPIIRNLKPIKNTVTPPADRLVLFVGDGIRAETFFDMKNGGYAPFLRSVIERKGSWGISNTHVPTESRPGHVAILAGMYEDPSAIFKGWQNYIVDFDSVLNRSAASFSWGSPDILNIFSRGSVKKESHFYTYPPEMQHFSGTNGSDLSLTYWVVEQFELFMKKIKYDNELAEMFHKKKVILFFHFLGPDVAGHASKPHSIEYVKNIEAVDESIKNITRIIDNYFNDGKTCYIFTSDHGMTDWGSHGGGTDAETVTPLVMWGAGVAQPLLKANLYNFPSNIRDEKNNLTLPLDWELDKFYRVDINQVDIAPLMSVLVGISIPVNSVGVLPTMFLDATPIWILHAVLLNIKQLKAQFDVVHESIKSNLKEYFYVKFPEPNVIDFIPPYNAHKSNQLEMEMIGNSINACSTYIKGIGYYRNYYSGTLQVILCLMFLAWILNLCVEIVSKSKIGGILFSYNFHYYNNIGTWDGGVKILMSALSIATVYLLYNQNMTFNFYAYSFLSIALWWQVIPKLKVMISGFYYVNVSIYEVIGYSLFFVFGLELLMVSFFAREMISGCLILVILLWAIEHRLKPTVNKIFIIWLLLSVIVSVFPFLPAVGGLRNIANIIESNIIWLISSFVVFSLVSEMKYGVNKLQLIMTVLTMINTLVIEYSFTHKQGLFLLSQLLSWTILGVSIFSLKFGPKLLSLQYIHIGHCLSSPFLLLSSGQEALFLNCLFAYLYLWILLEFSGFKQRIRMEESYTRLGLQYCDFRISFSFLTYVLLAFFGIGNIASLNSFDPSWTRGFLTLFSPFTMMVLILIKTVIPILLTTCALRVVLSICKESVEIIFYIVLLFCDIIVLQFFLLVTNQGSWLDIGTSLTRFIIMEALTIILLLLYGLALAIMPYKRPTRHNTLEDNLGLGFKLF